ncbi:MAG: cytochrome c maturation protein CcmE [Chloroflexi bacterium]|nr:cytochrome c maturation protein CcmE [Chloroflexota bacterium]
MTNDNWQKPKHPKKKRTERLKFISAGLLILAAVLYLLISGTLQGARYFITVRELLDDGSYLGRTVRISGAVDGESIEYDSEKAIIRFEIVNIPSEYDDLATALHEALLDRNAPRLSVIVEDAAIPDLLQHEAQAILTGALGRDGVFAGTELLLKCPSRFEESTPPEGLSRIPEHQ